MLKLILGLLGFLTIIPIRMFDLMLFLLMSAFVFPEHWIPHLWFPSIRLFIILPSESRRVTPSRFSVMIFSLIMVGLSAFAIKIPSAMDLLISFLSIIVSEDPLPPNAMFAFKFLQTIDNQINNYSQSLTAPHISRNNLYLFWSESCQIFLSL